MTENQENREGKTGVSSQQDVEDGYGMSMTPAFRQVQSQKQRKPEFYQGGRYKKTLEEHDKEYHGGKYDPDTMTCGLRDKMAQQDESDRCDVEGGVALRDATVEAVERVSNPPDDMKELAHQANMASVNGYSENNYHSTAGSRCLGVIEACKREAEKKGYVLMDVSEADAPYSTYAVGKQISVPAERRSSYSTSQGRRMTDEAKAKRREGMQERRERMKKIEAYLDMVNKRSEQTRAEEALLSRLFGGAE